jgi:hypothetical protein
MIVDCKKVFMKQITTAITDVAAIEVTIRKRLTRDFGASHGSSKPLARQFRIRWCCIGFANVLLHHFFISFFSEAI